MAAAMARGYMDMDMDMETWGMYAFSISCAGAVWRGG